MRSVEELMRGRAGAVVERAAVRGGHLVPDGMRGLGPVARALAPRLAGRDLVIDAGRGVRLSVPASPELVDGYLTGRPHRLEPETRRLLDRAVEPGDAFLDVGANVGFYAFRAAVAGGPEGVVHAFEPQSRLRPHLRRSLDLNARAGRAPVHLHHAAASDRETDTVLLHVGPGPVEVASVLAHEWLAGGAEEPVAAVTLDGVLESHGEPRADVVKVDVEGHELAVLRGFGRTLAARPPALVVAEALPRTMRFVSIAADGPLERAAETPAPSRLAELLVPYGYRLHRIDRGGRLVPGIDARDLDRVARPTNVAFLHRDAERAPRLGVSASPAGRARFAARARRRSWPGSA